MARPKRTLSRGLLEVLLLDEILVEHGGGDGGLVDDRGEVCAGEHRRHASDALEVDVRAELDLLGVDLEHLEAPLDVRQRDADLPIESARGG